MGIVISGWPSTDNFERPAMVDLGIDDHLSTTFVVMLISYLTIQVELC